MAWIAEIHGTPEGRRILEERNRNEVRSWNQYLEEYAEYAAKDVIAKFERGNKEDGRPDTGATA